VQINLSRKCLPNHKLTNTRNLTSPEVLKKALLYNTWEDAAVRRIVAIHKANSFWRWRVVVRWGVGQWKSRHRHFIGFIDNISSGDDVFFDIAFNRPP
jgi:hypothetical protein